MNNPFIKTSARLPINPIIQTLLGGSVGGAAATGLNEAVFSDVSDSEYLARIGAGIAEGTLLGNPLTRSLAAKTLTKPEKLRVTGDMVGKLTIPSSRVIRPVAGPVAVTSAVGMPIFLPSLADQGESVRKAVDLVINDYVSESQEDEGFAGYLARSVGEGLTRSIPEPWINSLTTQTQATLKRLGIEGIAALKQALEDNKPVFNAVGKEVGKGLIPVGKEVGKEVGKGLIPVGTGFAAGGLTGNLIARALTERSANRVTAEDERNWNKRNRLINVASLLGATLGGLGGYKLYEHNLTQ